MGSDMYHFGRQENEALGAKFASVPCRSELETIANVLGAQARNQAASDTAAKAAAERIAALEARIALGRDLEIAVREFADAQADPKRYDAARCALLALAAKVRK